MPDRCRSTSCRSRWCWSPTTTCAASSDTLGMPTWWHPQIDVDKFLFVGHEPTVWLQEHLKYAHLHWYDVLVALCYFSFFFLPYVTAAVLWLRGRADFYRWSLRFVALSFLGFAFFALIPAAPPWAAARCTRGRGRRPPVQPAVHGLDPAIRPSGGLLGRVHRPPAGRDTRASSASRPRVRRAAPALRRGA